MLEFLRRQLAALIEERVALQQQLEAVLAAPTREARGLSAAEQAEFDRRAAAVDALDARIAEMRAQVEQAEGRAGRAAMSAAEAVARGTTGPGYEPGRYTYRRGGEVSYFRDLVVATRDRDPAACERLERHARENRALSTVDGAGGFFVPPGWLLDVYGETARAGRPFADACTRLALPRTDSVSIPRLVTGTTVGVQTQGTAVSRTDPTDAAATSKVTTIAGEALINLQLLDQSPTAMDEVVARDLAAAYATELDRQVIFGDGTGQNLLGVLSVAGTNAVTYTDTTPTFSELYPKIAAAIEAVHEGVFLPPDAIWVHPRRWAWMLSAVDTQNRPLVVPDAAGPANAAGTAGTVASQGRVGSVQGIPVHVDASIPTNRGAGVNEDVIVVARMSELFLLESDLRIRVLPEPYASSLQVLVQAYAYSAFVANRRPAAVSVISGTGLVPPAL